MSSLLLASSHSIPILPVALLLLLLLLSSLLLLRHASTSSRHALPPGSLGFPLLGETLQFLFFESACPIGTPPPFLSARFQRYGRIFKTHLLGSPTVVSIDKDLNKHLLLNEGKLVRTYLPSSIVRVLGPVATWHGAQHKRLREIATAFLSTSAIQTYYFDGFQDHVHWILNSWRGKGRIDAQSEVQRLVFSFMNKHMTGLEPEHPLTIDMMTDFALLLSGIEALPINFPGTPFHRALKARERSMSNLRVLLRAKKKDPRPVAVDLLDRLLEATQNGGVYFSEEDLLNMVLILVFASFQTSAALIANMIKFLCENPQVVEEIRAEHTLIRKGRALNEKLTWDDYKSMQLTEKVINESLRLASVAHGLFRQSMEDIHFAGFTIPKGWTVFLSFSMIHLDPTFYPEPLQFNPKRWEDSPVNTPMFTPFGGGSRSCLGGPLIKFEAAMFLHYFVTQYRWERIIEHGELDQIASIGLPLMRKGLHIQLHPL